jgi:uncharacterized protein (DUF1800 family)
MALNILLREWAAKWGLVLVLVRMLVLVLVLAVAGPQAQAQPRASEPDTLHVLNRLSFGPAPGDIARFRQLGIEGYIDEQLHPERLPIPLALQEQLDSLHTTQYSQHDLVAMFRAAAQTTPGDTEDAKGKRRQYVQQIAQEAGHARLARAAQSPRQLQEVMVDFWFNHFNVYAGKGLDRVLVENYEREAIRPHALGRFRDLLGATAKHPAMLFYLDNWLSVAPGFQPMRGAGPLGKATGLNENYARELMELHTLGVDGGYTQGDVTELARMLTGWTINPRAESGTLFTFDPRRHDDGEKRWLGHTVEVHGQAEGEWALDVLATHPATARRVAFKLAQAFVADEPPPALVGRLAQRFEQTEGDIPAMLKTLFDSPEFRDPAWHGAKFKTPYRAVVSTLRAVAAPVTRVRPLLGALQQQGMPLYGCPTPDGYKNTEAAWLNPDGVTRRVGFATAFAAGRLMLDPSTPPVDATGLLATLGQGVSVRTRAAVAQADPALQGALVLGSPDFMRY